MTNGIILLGSTGSIGRQTLSVCQEQGIPVRALTAGRNKNLLYQQALEFHPDMISIQSDNDAQELCEWLSDCDPPIQVFHGREGNRTAAAWNGADTLVAAMVGVAGLEPVLTGIQAGKTIALANKETLVAGGALVMPKLQACDSRLYPVDSEHSAVWQCLAGIPDGSLRRIFLTASGGPFRGRSQKSLTCVTVEDALAHPTWRMGGKISVDSATMMNKGLEVIEASWLFHCPVDHIEVVVHPQSIIHSMVELTDGSVLAQMGFPDMRLPIQLALTWPQRVPSSCRSFNPFDSSARSLTFEEPDRKTFRLLDLAYEAGRTGGTLPAVMNAANEAAVNLFLAGRISFLEIANQVERCMDKHVQSGFMKSFDFDVIMEQDHWARQQVHATLDQS